MTRADVGCHGAAAQAVAVAVDDTVAEVSAWSLPAAVVGEECENDDVNALARLAVGPKALFSVILPLWKSQVLSFVKEILTQ